MNKSGSFNGMFSFCRALWKSVCLATSERFLLEDLDNLIKYQPESVIIHAGTNDLTNGINMLNNAKKIVKELTSKLRKVKIAFSGLITRDKKITESKDCFLRTDYKKR